MHTFLFALASTTLLACAASSPADETGTGGGGGGKADDTTSSCPVAGNADKILAAIEGGGNCRTASGIAEACAYGSSLDVQFVAAATDVCSTGFDAMPTAMRATYDSLVSRCGDKFASESGTLYRSMAAFCTLEVTHLFAMLFPEADAAEPVVPFEPECPVDLSDEEKIEEAIRKAPYCALAADVADRCAWLSSIDVQFTAAASETCTSGLDAMTAADKATRDGLYARCGESFSEFSGTLGTAMTAHCSLQVDVVFDSLYSPVE